MEKSAATFLIFITRQMQRLALHFRPPYDFESREGALWLRDIADALTHFREDIIEAAVAHLVRNHKGRFPFAAEIVEAAKDAAKKAGEMKRLESHDVAKVDEYQRLKRALAWLNTELGQQALRQGWAADFAAKIKRGDIAPEFCEPAKELATHETFGAMINPQHAIWAEIKSRDAMYDLAISIARRAQKTREKYLHGWDQVDEPYDDLAWRNVMSFAPDMIEERAEAA